MKSAAEQVKAGGIKTVVTGVKRHTCHVKAKEDERNSHPPPVKAAYP